MVRKDHYDQIDNSNNQYAKLKILFPTHDFDFVFTPLQIYWKDGEIKFSSIYFTIYSYISLSLSVSSLLSFSPICYLPICLYNKTCVRLYQIKIIAKPSSTVRPAPPQSAPTSASWLSAQSAASGKNNSGWFGKFRSAHSLYFLCIFVYFSWLLCNIVYDIIKGGT